MSVLEQDSHNGYTVEAYSQTSNDALTKYLASDSGLKDAIVTLTTPIHAARSSCDEPHTDDLTQHLWTSLLDTVQLAPSPSYAIGALNDANRIYLTKLIDLLDAIRQSPFPSPTSQDDPSWSSLPGFGASVRKAWNIDANTLPDNLPAQNAWTNLNTFIALLWSRYSPEQQPEPYDFALYPIWTLRLTLETPQPLPVLKALIPAAAAWVCNASSRAAIWALCQRRETWTPGGGSAPAKTGPLWEEAGKDREDGYCEERYRFWRERFGDVAWNREIGGTTEPSRETAMSAVRAMGSVWGGMRG